MVATHVQKYSQMVPAAILRATIVFETIVHDENLWDSDWCVISKHFKD